MHSWNFGFLDARTTDTPEDQKFLFIFVPVIFFAKSFENLPFTLEKFTPTFLQ